MTRRDRVLIGISVAALGGVAVLFASLGWYLWRGSFTAEEELMGGLATSLGARTEVMIGDTRGLLADFDKLPQERCSPGHLRALQAAAMGRPHIRGIGYWKAAERQCGVGFLQVDVLRPARADKIYPSGFIAWWPSKQTEVGGVQLFLMRFGDHDVAIDPRGLLDVGPLQGRQVELWLENLRLAAEPDSAKLPPPDSLKIGLTIDRLNGRAISRYSRGGEFPIELVALEPLGTFWGRYAVNLVVGLGIGVVLLAGWLFVLMRYTRHRLSLASMLRSALANQKLHVVYQPVIDLRTGRCVAAEALARWTMEGGAQVSPESFVPVAELTGQTTELAIAVLRRTVKELGPTLRAVPQLCVNVNLSAAELTSDRFAVELESTLAGGEVPQSSITFELTERALVGASESRGTIDRFRAKGHRVAIDDFGTGYSSLSYLSDFSLDLIKIDKAFVHSIGTEAATSHVITHVIEMARALGIRTVAEGVETEAQRNWLQAQGVDYGQGWLFSAPLSAETFISFVKQPGKKKK
jgi:sensor c-di-GMP phosphodiesterase-like protein